MHEYNNDQYFIQLEVDKLDNLIASPGNILIRQCFWTASSKINCGILAKNCGRRVQHILELDGYADTTYLNNFFDGMTLARFSCVIRYNRVWWF